LSSNIFAGEEGAVRLTPETTAVSGRLD
jgi:hypothetical protein